MNTFKILAVAVVALSSSALVQGASKLEAAVQLSKGKPAMIVIDKANGKGKFIYMNRQTEAPVEVRVASCKTFQIQTPADLVRAVTAYRAGDIKGARKMLSSVKKKYASFVGLPGNPSSEAAELELMCAICMADWESVASLSASYPGVSSLNDMQKATLEVAKLLGKISDDPATSDAQIAAAKALQKEQKANLSLASYGMLEYAIGRAYGAKLPASLLRNNRLPDPSRADGVLAADAYCQAAMAQRGANMGFTSEALTRAAKVVWAMPGNRAYVEELGSTKMDRATWMASPADFREAVSIAFILTNVINPDSTNDEMKRIAAYYFNAQAK